LRHAWLAIHRLPAKYVGQSCSSLVLLGLAVLREVIRRWRSHINPNYHRRNPAAGRALKALVDGAGKVALESGGRGALHRWRDAAERAAGKAQIGKLVGGLQVGCALRYSEALCALRLNAFGPDSVELTVPAGPITDKPPWGPKGGEGPEHVGTLAGVGTQAVKGVVDQWAGMAGIKGVVHHAGALASGLSVVAAHRLSAGMNQLVYDSIDLDYCESGPPGR
jgi:hypothetical protein